jgi:hypothetical protein
METPLTNLAFGDVNKLPRGKEACSRGVAPPRREQESLDFPRMLSADGIRSRELPEAARLVSSIAKARP